MTSINYCEHCGFELAIESHFCPQCGAKINADLLQNSTKVKEPITEKSVPITYSKKSGKTILVLCILVGMFGIHRMYVKKFATGFLMLLTIGGLGIWVLLDLILIVSNKFTDKEGEIVLFSQGNSSLKELVSIFGAVFLWFGTIILSAVIGIYYMTSALVTTINQQLTFLQQGNISQAYSYTSSQFQSNLSLADFTQYINALPAFKNNASSSFNERRLNVNTGSIGGILTAKDGTKTSVVYELTRENGQWKISNIRILP